MAFEVYPPISLSHHLMLTDPVTEDLVRYMDFATEDGNNFLVDDPQWAIDFAPNGIFRLFLSENTC